MYLIHVYAQHVRVNCCRYSIAGKRYKMLSHIYSNLVSSLSDNPKLLWQTVNKLLSPVHTSNNVEATFDIVAFDNVASTLLLVWTGHYTVNHLYRYFCPDRSFWLMSYSVFPYFFFFVPCAGLSWLSRQLLSAL